MEAWDGAAVRTRRAAGWTHGLRRRPATPCTQFATLYTQLATPCTQFATPCTHPVIPCAQPATPYIQLATPCAQPATPCAQPATPCISGHRDAVARLLRHRRHPALRPLRVRCLLGVRHRGQSMLTCTLLAWSCALHAHACTPHAWSCTLHVRLQPGSMRLQPGVPTPAAWRAYGCR